MSASVAFIASDCESPFDFDSYSDRDDSTSLSFRVSHYLRHCLCRALNNVNHCSTSGVWPGKRVKRDELLILTTLKPYRMQLNDASPMNKVDDARLE